MIRLTTAHLNAVADDHREQMGEPGLTLTQAIDQVRDTLTVDEVASWTEEDLTEDLHDAYYLVVSATDSMVSALLA